MLSRDRVDFPVSENQFLRVTRGGTWELHWKESSATSWRVVSTDSYPVRFEERSPESKRPDLDIAVAYHETRYHSRLRDLLEGKVAFDDVTDPAFRERNA